GVGQRQGDGVDRAVRHLDAIEVGLHPLAARDLLVPDEPRQLPGPLRPQRISHGRTLGRATAPPLAGPWEPCGSGTRTRTPNVWTRTRRVTDYTIPEGDTTGYPPLRTSRSTRRRCPMIRPMPTASVSRPRWYTRLPIPAVSSAGDASP